MKGKYPNGLKEAMERVDIGPTELARRADTSKQQVARLADGERELTGYWAELLSPHVDTSPEELIFPHRRLSAQRVPLVSMVAAGKLAATEGVTNIDAKRHIVVGDLPKGVWIALTVDGDSMNLIAPPGAAILVNRADAGAPIFTVAVVTQSARSPGNRSRNRSRRTRRQCPGPAGSSNARPSHSSTKLVTKALDRSPNW